MGFTMVEILSTLVLIGIMAATVAPRFINISVFAKKKATAAGIAEFNGREKLLWHKAMLVNDPAVWVDDETLDQSIYDSMDFDLNSGTESDWAYSDASWAAEGVAATLTFKGVESDIWRDPATLDTPGRWAFSSDIENILFSGFTSTTGFSSTYDNADKWDSSDDGTLSIAKENGYALIDGTDFGDYTISLDATLSDGSGYGIIYSATETGDRFPDGYCFQFDEGYPDSFVVRKFTAGGESAIAAVSMSDVFGDDFDLTAEHSISITVVDGYQTISVDGKVIIADLYDATYSSGSVGVRAWGYSEVVIENMEVTEE